MTAIALCAVFGLSAFTACSKMTNASDLPNYYEHALHSEVKPVSTESFGLYRGPGMIKFDLPGYTLELECDNDLIREDLGSKLKQK